MKQTFIAWPDVFTPAEMDAIEEMGDAIMPPGRGEAANFVRLAHEARSAAVYERLAELVPRVNQQFFQFDVTALEKIQYGVYRGGEDAPSNWTMDYHEHGLHSRKISLIVQLGDPSRYEGGDIEFRLAPSSGFAPRTRGTVIAFPAFFLHRVAPVTSGTRKMLISWATGPEFR